MSGGLALVAHAAGDVRLDPVLDPALTTGQVRVEVAYGGICGSDIHYATSGAVGAFALREPLILGHEISGRVVELGPGVSTEDIDVDTSVVPHPATVDGTCARCLDGAPNQCLSARYLGSAASWPHTQGGFRDRIVLRADQLIPLPEGLGRRRAALSEPLAVGVHALRRAVAAAGYARSTRDPEAALGAGHLRDKRVLVVGSGPIGALITAAAASAGAQVSTTDLSSRALRVATEVGATETFDVTGLSPEQSAEAILASGGPVDIVLESSGSSPGLATALHAVRRGGVVVMVGLPPPNAPAVPMSLVASREVTVTGAFRFDDEVHEAVAMLAAGLDLEAVMTHEFALADGVEAIVTAADPQVSTKVLLRMQ